MSETIDVLNMNEDDFCRMWRLVLAIHGQANADDVTAMKERRAVDKIIRAKCPNCEAECTVNLERGFYYCFTCRAAGSGHDYMMARHGKTFHEADKMFPEELQVVKPKAGEAVTKTICGRCTGCGTKHEVSKFA